MTKDLMINMIQNMSWAQELGLNSPAKRQLISDVIDQVATAFWHRHSWTFRQKTSTFSTIASTSTYTMEPEVDKILEITYDDGGVTRYVRYRGQDFLAEQFDGTTKDGTMIYWWSDYAMSEDGYIIQLLPTPNAVFTCYLKYFRTLNNISDIPEKYHHHLLVGARGFFTEGMIEGYMPFEAAIATSMKMDKPQSIKKWSMSADKILDGGLK